MISKQQQKYIQSLHNKKYRTEYGEFLVEGEKGLDELLASDFEVVRLFCSEEFSAGRSLSGHPRVHEAIIAPVSAIAAVSTFKSNSAGVAVVKQKRPSPPQNFEKVTLILDQIHDPGNLGTVIRLADWYGIRNVVCSPETVEFYNPKVISATMGSFTRVNVFYTPLPAFLHRFGLPVYGADLEGANVHHHDFEEKIGLVIGSESHGISPEVAALLKARITIPRIGTAESLNAAMATGIILDNIFRGV
ncbi:RNA methyltransferase [Leadbetterella sp. DM7]|uniref:RNA methyltransferase n=1 Tax=Leadbetterella sp. DM7 TaxID=3235085 RepID=UPI00349EF1EA